MKDELRQLVEDSDLNDWKAILAILCTYATRDDFAIFCGLLGDRLQQSGNLKSATLCYICAGNIDKTVNIWVQSANSKNQSYNESLQSLIEKVSIFRRAVGHKQQLSKALADKYSEYAEILASQGRLLNAMHCLSFLTDTKYDDVTGAPFILLDRLYHAIGAAVSALQ